MRLRFLSFLIFVSVLAAQTDVTVNVTGTGPLGSKASIALTKKGVLVTYSINNCTIDANGICSLNISIASRTPMTPAGLQFDLTYSATDVKSVAVAAGQAATNASKTITCTTVSPSDTRCIISGINQNGIADGVVAVATVTTSLTSQAGTTVAVVGTVSATLNGSPITSVVAPGGGTITMPALVATLTCDGTSFSAGTSVNCQVSLNKPAASVVTVTLSSDSPTLVTLPASVTVAAGATTSALFAVTGT